MALQPTTQIEHTMTIKVLVIDDYPPAAEMLSLVMEMKGYDVQQASNAHKALEILKNFCPDVVLCDINMPGIDGYDLCTQLRKDTHLSNTLFIAQTALSRQEAGHLIKAAGFDHHVVKPIDIGVLDDHIKKHTTSIRKAA